MGTDERRERLRVLTGEAAGTAGRLPDHRDLREPAAGDLYALQQTAELPVEWAVLGPDPDTTGLWVAVPADTNPLRGPGDLWLGLGESGGPLCLRCRFAVRIPRTVLENARRTGTLAPEIAARAMTVHRDHERGELPLDPLAEEVAVDPEYRDWEDDVLSPARAAATTAARRAEAARPANPTWGRRRPLLALAAALTLLAVGLGAWAWQLRQQIERLSQPLLLGGSEEIVVGSGLRGPVTLEWRASDEYLLVFVVLAGEALESPRHRVELEDAEGRVVWSSPEVSTGTVPELNLVLGRRFLEEARPPLRLVLFGIEGGREHRVAAVPLRIGEAEETPRDGDESD